MEFSNLMKCLDDLVYKKNTPGVDCIVYKDHKYIFRYFTGMRDLENNIPIDGNELYFIFSMTKMLTCVSALQLFEKGMYSMEDSISIYLPEFSRMRLTNAEFSTDSASKITTGNITGEATAVTNDGYAKNPIRVIDLFTMGGGLDYNLKPPAILKALQEGKTTTRELVGALAETVLGFEPGTRFRYSLCHDVLGALIEVWSGKKLGDYMLENIFNPLGMKDTRFGLPESSENLSRLAAKYKFVKGVPQLLPLDCAYNLSEDYQSGGAGLASSTEDYALFLDAMACGGVGRNGNRILREETVAMMKTNQLKGQALEDFHQLRRGYGYGLGVRTHMEPSVSGSLSPVGEFGWDGAAGAFSMVDTKNKLSLTYFQHIYNWDIQLQTDLRNALYQDLN